MHERVREQRPVAAIIDVLLREDQILPDPGRFFHPLARVLERDDVAFVGVEADAGSYDAAYDCAGRGGGGGGVVAVVVVVAVAVVAVAADLELGGKRRQRLGTVEGEEGSHFDAPGL